MSNLEVEKLVSQLTESNRKMEIFRKVSFELNKLVSLPEKLHTILSILDDQFGLRNTVILLPDEQKQWLTVCASHGYDSDMIGRQIAFGQGIIGLAAVRKRHINLTGIRRKQHYLATVGSEGDVNFVLPIGLADVESQVAIPLLSNHELVAVLMAESREFCVYDKADENFLITLAQPLAVSMQNSMLYDSMEKKIAERTAELRQLNDTKDKFFSIISHDLRGPVTSFQSLTRLISHYNRQGQADKIESLFTKVDHSVDNLNHLLENLLDWSLNQTNGISAFFEEIHLSFFLSEIADIYAASVCSKEITIDIAIDDHIRVLGDKHTLATVFRNLISNSIKFTPRRGSISITAENKDETVWIHLHDTGVGMDCAKLFNLFNLQAKRPSLGTEKEKGTGLGLVLVKEFIELNKGTINIHSSSSSGTDIYITLPSMGENA